MYKYLFGPVPSRRLGMSLGVDLVPAKVCSLDCVYCEVGSTTKHTVDRLEYVPLETVKAELDHYFEHQPNPDYITFSGSGEPTLNLRLGDIIGYLKSIKPEIPVAVLTNGTSLSDGQVRKELLNADLVLPSLDAATQGVFERINRPEKTLGIERVISGIITFRQEFEGKIWLEVFILPGYNDAPAELVALGEAISRINPDKVQLNTLDRPGTVENIQSASADRLRRIADDWKFSNIEIIARPAQRKHHQSYRSDTASAILDTIARRPCTLDDMAGILGLNSSEINKYLDVLEAEGKIRTSRQDRGVFYSLTGNSS